MAEKPQTSQPIQGSGYTPAQLLGAEADETNRPGGFTSPHRWTPRRWRIWICDRCYAPRSLHPREWWSVSRPLGDSRYLSADAPHFKEDW